MALSDWTIRIAGIGTAPPSFVGPTLEFAVGPDEVRVDWGADDPYLGTPRLVTYLPDAGGSFALASRLYADGQFVISATGVLGAEERVIHVGVFTFPSATDGLRIDGASLADFAVGGSGADTVFGRGGNDFMTGMGGADAINGGNGNDHLSGGAGDDTIDGGAGDDVVFGGEGNDVLRAGPGQGSDALFGMAGDDRLFAGENGGQLDGGDGRDVLTGGAGADWFMYVNTPDGVRDSIRGFTPGEDRLVLTFLRETGVPMTPDRLVTSFGAMDDDGPWVIYGTASGRLLVDMNGTDAGGRIELAMLDGAPPIGFDDFLF